MKKTLSLRVALLCSLLLTVVFISCTAGPKKQSPPDTPLAAVSAPQQPSVEDIGFGEVYANDDFSGALCEVIVNCRDGVNQTVLIESETLTGEQWTDLSIQQKTAKFEAFKATIEQYKRMSPVHFAAEVLDRKITKLYLIETELKAGIVELTEKVLFRS